MLIRARGFRPAIALVLAGAAAILLWRLRGGVEPGGIRPGPESPVRTAPAAAMPRGPAADPVAFERTPRAVASTPEAAEEDRALLRVLAIEGPPEAELALMPVAPWRQAPGPGRFRTRDGVSLRLLEEQALRGAPDPAGGWRFEAVRPGRYSLESLDPEWTPAAPALLELAAGERRELELRLAPASSLTVFVCTPEGAPLPKAWVHLFLGRSDPANAAEAVHLATEPTGPDGTVVFDALSPRRDYDLLAAGIPLYHRAEARECAPGAGAVRLVMQPARNRLLRILDGESRRPIAGATVLQLDPYVLELYQGNQTPAGPENGGLCAYQERSNAAGVVQIADLPDAVLLIEAEGYVQRSVFAPGRLRELEILMHRWGKLAGRVSDLEGRPVAGAEIEYVLKADLKRLGRGKVLSAQDGVYEIPLAPEQRQAILQATTESIELFARHPSSGIGDRLVQDLGLHPEKDWEFAQLDLVLAPVRKLRIQLIPGAEPLECAEIDYRFSVGHERDALSAAWLAAPEFQAATVAEDGSVEVEWLPAAGEAWFHVVSRRGGGARPLAAFGPIRLEDLDQEWRVAMPRSSDLGALELDLDLDPGAMGLCSLSLFWKDYYRDGQGMSFDWSQPVAPGRIRVDGLLPGRYAVRVNGRALTRDGRVLPPWIEIHPGGTTRLGKVSAGPEPRSLTPEEAARLGVAVQSRRP